MTIEIEKHIDNLLNFITRKDELDRLLFDIAVFGDRIGYRSVATNNDDPEARKSLISDSLTDISSSEIREYLSSLISSNETKLFEPGCFKIFVEELGIAAKRSLFFTLTTAVELTKEDIREISEKLTHEMGRRVLVDTYIDPSIIGGAVIKKDGYIFDFSLKTKLVKLSSEWKKAINNPAESNV